MTSGDAWARLVSSSTTPSPSWLFTTPSASVKYAASPTAAAMAIYGDRDRPPMGNVSLTCGSAVSVSKALRWVFFSVAVPFVHHVVGLGAPSRTAP